MKTPFEKKAAIDGDYREFNRAYERFAEANRVATPAPVKAGPGRDVIEKILAAKESRKEGARAEPAGLMRGNRASFLEGEPTGRKEEIFRLKKAIKMHPNDVDLATALAKHYVGDL